MWIEDGIFYVIHTEGVVITKEIAVSQVNERLRISNGVIYPMYIDARGIKYATKDAREYTKGADGIKYINAGGFLINNAVLEILTNYYFKFNRPKIPVKLFTDQAKALQWLQQFKNPIKIHQLG